MELELLNKIVDMLNDKDCDNIEVLYIFRKHYNLVNRFVCDDCGYISKRITIGVGCDICGKSNVNCKVIKLEN